MANGETERLYTNKTIERLNITTVIDIDKILYPLLVSEKYFIVLLFIPITLQKL